ncbi:hypothetical protein ACTG9Q_15615 [Actinokineospora sp. 24-640]
MTRPLPPAGRDAGVAKVTRVTIGVVAAGIAGTLGLGAAIAAAAPPPKQAGDYSTEIAKAPTRAPGTGEAEPPPDGGGQGPEPTLVPPDDRPESSSGDEDTTSGGS